jgi:ketosteroid isomerase-like protein
MNIRISLLLALLLAGCASASSDDITRGDADRAIRRANEQLVAALRDGNYGSVASFYSDSASLLPPGGQAIIGRGDITQFWAGVLRGGGVDAKIFTEDIEQSCDMAAERGRFSLGTTSGKYVVVWRKIRGQWRIWSDVYNYDK